MTVSRRTLIGGGLLAASAVVTGGVWLAQRGALKGVGVRLDDIALQGFIGGEKKSLLESPDMVALLTKKHGLTVDAKVAGSVEQCRDPALLAQGPNFLWPASEILVDVAKAAKVAIKRDAVLLRSPIVIFSWEPIAQGLKKAGLASQEGDVWFVDSDKLIKALMSGTKWADLGVPQLAGRARISATDPTKSSSGMHFAGLVANLLSGDIATNETLARDSAEIASLFHRMGFKTHSSAKLFESYLGGGMGGAPLIVGYENQLVEWILEDPTRWANVQKNAPDKPVTLYPRPTVVSTHAFMALNTEAIRLLDALASEPAQQLAWSKHGFRGSLGVTGAETNPLVAGRMPKALDAILPLPEANVLLALLDRLASPAP